MAHYHLNPNLRGRGFEPGVANGCPFCLARLNPRPKVGTTIVFLSGFDAGQTGVVVQDHGWSEGDGLLAARMNYGARDVMTVNPSLQLYVEAGTLAVPAWMPPLSIDDVGALHEQVLRSMEANPSGKLRQNAARVAGDVAVTCWSFRLPLTAREVWAVVAAHGMRRESERATMEFFDFAIELLVSANGRAPVKRRRMPPLSRGQYMTKRQRPLSIRLFGHD